MNHLILTETDFFRQINGNDRPDLRTAYNEFVKRIIELCHGCANRQEAFPALAYAEIELQHYEGAAGNPASEDECTLHVRKALLFIRKMLKQLAANLPAQVPPPTSAPSASSDKAMPPATLRWTGSAVDLIEIIYGLDEMGCINNGDIPIGELASFFYTLLGVEAKACYRFYTDIKHRKNDSRTYFLDKMKERLNERMRRDDEREMQRR